MAKFVFVTGGVVSGLGKGLTASSLGRLLKARGYKVTLQKFDPYFNVDSSYLSPYQHGEIFVTDDGGEADLVVGHYERTIEENLGRNNDVTSGQIYSSVIAKERNGEYNGRTVQVVPHITNEIKSYIRSLDTGEFDIIITEIGGTVGDIECHPFLEAIRQFQSEAGKENVVYVHVTLVPYIEMSGEQKTKPTQRSVKELQNVGIQPDIIVCRSEYAIDNSSKKKLSLFCNVKENCIIQNLNTDKLYSVPLLLEEEGFAAAVLNKLKLEVRDADLTNFKEFCKKADENAERKNSLKIGIVGKYTDKKEAYVSLTEALFYSGTESGVKFEIVWVNSGGLCKENSEQILGGLDGYIIGAGFGERGFEGKIEAARFARVNDVPVLMTGFGAQAGLIEFSRNVAGIDDADSEEFSYKTLNPVVVKIKGDNGGFKRGGYETILKAGSLISRIYSSEEIRERHRHKFEFNKTYEKILSEKGLIFSGYAKENNIPETFELKNKKFFVGVIYRPEFTARLSRPNPLISAFIQAVKKNSKKK